MSARFTSREVAAILGLAAPAEERVFRRVVTDTREDVEGGLFVALRGERHDGADFLEAAARGGALGAVVPAGRERSDLGLPCFPAEDTTRALGELAAFHRRRTGARVIGITGSSGKTTVKEMLAAALSSVGRVHRTEGNRNNQIGVPLTILEAPGNAAVWILELGTSRPGEIARLTEIARPDDALVTTVGPAHLEGLGDVAGVLREKLALVQWASPRGEVVVGERPPELAAGAREIRPDARVAGLGAEADFRPDEWTIGPASCEFVRRSVPFRVEAGGEHHLRDALLAVAMATAIGEPPARVARGLATWRPTPMRSVLRRHGRLDVLVDCYNANPESFAAAIDYCRSAFPGRRLAAFVGTMRELGGRSEALHREVAGRILDAGFELVAATGEFSRAFERSGRPTNGTRLVAAEEPTAAWEAFSEALEGGEVLLVKGSRGARLERIVQRIAERFGPAED